MEGIDEPTRPRAWEDEQDGPSLPRPSPALPAWALSDAARAARDGKSPPEDEAAEGDFEGNAGWASGRKRARSDGLSALLSRTTPLLEAKSRATPAGAVAVGAVLPLPRDAARVIQWHPNGQLVLVGGNRHLYIFHTAGKLVERLSKLEIGARVESACLTSSGEEALVVGRDSYIPQIVSLSTERLTALRFLDTRGTAEYRNGRRDHSKKDFTITKLAVRAGDSSTSMLALASGRTVKLASLRTASVLGGLAFDDPVCDLCFPSATTLAIAAGRKVLLYDIRKTATYVSTFKDDAILDITSFAWGPRSLVLGSSSGVVSLYEEDGKGTTPGDGGGFSLVKGFMNLTTAIHGICLGKDRGGEPLLAFFSRSQKAGFRLASLPSCVVVPGFPWTTMRHGFVQSMAMAPTLPILSVGERQKVTNYIL
ncbi:unnamed protein product [Phytomonas sp. Hart1]|nr:unnamed protein product [Phytomonas sp. Hart1]|eukprot:CCW69888.1 unnamed protein product [Phytomonas sp. isolate Hart1]